MSSEGTSPQQVANRTPAVRQPTASELIDRLSRFEGPPEQFLINLLAVQCHLSGAECGAVLRPAVDGGTAEVLAVYPQLPAGSTAPVWLAQSVEASPEQFRLTQTAIRPVREAEDLYGQPARRHLVMIPLLGGQGARGVAAFVVASKDPAALDRARERLELTVSLLSLYEMRLTLQRRQGDLGRLRAGMEAVASVDQQERFTGAAMALCNEIAARWECDRVGLGFLQGRYVKLRAMSHTENFNRKMKLVQDLEAAMEECLDQDVEVVVPAPPDATYVCRAAQELSRRHGPHAIVSFPIRRGGEVKAVLTVEHPVDRPFRLEQIEALRLTCEMISSRLVDLERHDKWFGAKLAAGVRDAAGWVVGPKHTWAKLAGVGVMMVLVALFVARGDYTATAPCVMQPEGRRVVSVPFTGYLGFVPDDIEPGTTVIEGQLLARLKTTDIEEKLRAAQADRLAYQHQASEAMDAGRTAEQKMAEALADKAGAQIALLEHQLALAELSAPIDGTIARGDLRPNVNAPVDRGDALFEIIPNALEAELKVPEDRIPDVKVGSEGELATTGYPGRRIRFRVTDITPEPEVVDKQNVYSVRVELLDVDRDGEHAWLRPGLEGVAKVHLGRRRLAWLWTRRAINWVRMKLWI